MGFGRRLLVGCLAALAVVGCTGGGDGERSTPTTAPSVPLDGLNAVSVRSGAGGAVWLRANTGGGAEAEDAVYRVDRDRASKVFDLGRFQQSADMAAFGARLVVAGVRCDDECSRTVTEVVAVDDRGRVTEWGAVDSLPRPPDGDTDVAHVLGSGDELVWVSDPMGRLRAFDESGRQVGDTVIPPYWAERCLVDGDLHQVGDIDPPVDRPDGATIAVEPGTRRSFSVSRWDGERFVPVPDGHLPSQNSPGAFATCVHDGFEVTGPTGIVRWQPDSGWRGFEPAGPPPGARSAHAQSTSLRQYVLDATGVLIDFSGEERVPLDVRFDVPSASDFIGRLFVDDANDHLVACYEGPLRDLQCQQPPSG